MNTPAGCVEVPLGVFNGHNLELNPTDLPKGLSWGCTDVAFGPGEMATRPPLQRLSTLGTAAQIVYETTFPRADGVIVKLQFDSLGGMYADGVQIGQTAAGNRFQVAKLFGRAYIAISDGLHGADVPLQFDGYNLDRVSQDGPAGVPTVQNYALPAQAMTGEMVRAANQVTVQTANPTGVRVGYQVNVEGVPNATTAVQTITIDNDVLSGVATVTMPAAHGFVPGDEVTLIGITPATVGGGMQGYTTTSGGGTTTVTTNQPHLLRVGDAVVVSLGAGGGGGALFPVEAVVSATEFTFANPRDDGNGSQGNVTLPWVPDSGSEFTIQAVPTPTTFQIAVSQGNGTWTSGSVTFAWNGTFYVAQVLNPTSFQYTQAGPNGSTDGSVGTVTPAGQVTPGDHKLVWIFVTRTGAVLAPGPQVTITASGGGYLQTVDAPIGPANVVARWAGITGANGGEFFVLPVPPQINGQVVGTSTVIPDNVTTTAIFDFSDQALYSGIDIGPKYAPGNNLFQQEVLEGALGFYGYADRLAAWGERNTMQQFRNMGFEGGVSAAAPTLPLGWTLGPQGGGGTLVAGDYGMGWQMTGGGTGTDGTLWQTAYQDENGEAILQPNTQYSFRCWAKGNGAAVAMLYSPSAANPVLAQAQIPCTAAGGFAQVQFTAKTPAAIPADAQFRISAQGLQVGQTATVDELNMIPTTAPYRKPARVSYAINPEAFDGVTGVLGSSTDQQPVMGMTRREDTLCLLTFGPNGSLYETEDSASGEPASWELRHKAGQCGLLSVWGIADFEDWFCWVSDTGVRIFDGGGVDKISQEIQPWWNTINPAARQFTVLANDPYTRRMYCMAATGTATVPNAMQVMDYRELNSAAALAGSGTLHISAMSGKVVTTDLTRKWAAWSVTANYGEVMLFSTGAAEMVFCGGFGNLAAPGQAADYTLGEGLLTGVDADYGPFWQRCFYPTYFFLDAQDAMQMQLGTHRLLHTFLTMNATGNGALTMQPFVNRSTNPGTALNPRPLTPTLTQDLYWPLNVAGERVSYGLGCQPAGVQPFGPTAQAGFRVSSLVVAMKTHPYSPIR